MSNADVVQRAYAKAYRYEAERGSCPQCVLAALFETLDVGDETLIQAGDALAGGSALCTTGTCGALAGGLMALSSLTGRTYKNFSEGRRNRVVFKYATMLLNRFVEEYQSPLCCDVQTKLFGKSYDLLDKDQYAAFEQAGAHVDKCPSVAGNVARWTAKIILEHIKKDE